MKHLRKGRKFGRVKRQRKAMLRSLVGNLIMQERIKTTEAKAKEIRGVTDKIINKAKLYNGKNKKVAIAKELRRALPEAAAKKITGEFINRFAERNSGYTRVLKLDLRKSDSAKEAIIEFV